MPEVIINGPEGRIEGRYHHARGGTAPMALVLHPHPLHGGTMNKKLVHKLSHQRDIKIDYRKISGADHFFLDSSETVATHVDAYIEAHARVGERAAPATAGRGR